jgi:hypothetical protein
MGGRRAIGWFMLSEADRAVSARLLEQSEADGTRVAGVLLGAFDLSFDREADRRRSGVVFCTLQHMV